MADPRFAQLCTTIGKLTLTGQENWTRALACIEVLKQMEEEYAAGDKQENP